jgi:hypothetical protein
MTKIPNPKLDELVKSRKIVIPANAGVQSRLIILDSRFRGKDAKARVKPFYDFIKD